MTDFGFRFERMNYAKVYQVRYLEVEGGDVCFVNDGGKWEWSSLGDAEYIMRMFYLTRKQKGEIPFDLYITETPDECDEEVFEEEFGIPYPEPVVIRPEMKFNFAGSCVFN